MKWSNVLAAALLAACSSTTIAQDAPEQGASSLAIPGFDRTDAVPVTRNTRLVTFRYSPDVSFSVRSLPGVFTNVEVPDGEQIHGFYLSDDVSWEYLVTKDQRRVLLKPSAAGTINTATLVTSQRTYELTLASVNPGEIWHQRVRWQVPGSDGNRPGEYWAPPKAGTAPGSSAGIGALRFGCAVKGKAAGIAPSVVFDDGTRTWFRFEGHDVPAIFAGTGKDLDIVEFAMIDGYVVTPHIAERWTLRLHKDSVQVECRR